MVTRSQALAKRKADEQLPGSEHPAKSSKSGSSDDSSTSRRRRRASQESGKARKDRGDVENGDVSENAGGTVPQKSVPAPRSSQTEPEDLATPAESLEKDSPETAEDGTVKAPEAQEEAPTETSGDRTRREEDQRNRNLAMEVMQQLQVIVERWRLSDGPAMPTSHDDKQLESIADLCGLLTRHEDTHLNPFLIRFPPLWFEDMRDLQERLEQLETSRKQLAEATEKVEHCSATYDMAVSKRGDSYVGAGDRSQEARQSLRDAVHEARKPYLEALKTWYEARERSEELTSRTWSMIFHVLPTADKTLVCDGYLRHWRGDHSVAPSEDGSQDGSAALDGESLRTATHIRYVSRLGHGGSQRRTTSPPPEDRQVRHERTPDRSRSPHRRPEDDEPEVVEDIVADRQRDKRRKLERARAAYERALNSFDSVRNRYYGDLIKFMDKQRRNVVRGTRTDLDHNYYIARGEANREATAARDAFEFAVEQADMTGALTLGQRILLFRDEADSQRAEGENPLTRMLRETSNERIEAWARDEAQKDIVSKSQWSDLVSEPKQEGDSVVSVDEPEGEERLATGKRRRSIDQWQRQQRRERAETAFAVLPSMLPKGAEVQCFLYHRIRDNKDCSNGDLTIDTLGDVQLVVNKHNEQAGYIVSSAVLRLASPVFAALVGPRFAEGNAILERKDRNSVPVDVDLHDDDFEALEILLNIIHLRPTRTPDLEGLIQLAIVVDKYQAAASVQTQTAVWMEDQLHRAGFCEYLPEYLGLAIVFNACRVYNMVAIGIALTTPWRNWDDCGRDELKDRISKTALAHKVPEKAVAGIRQLMTVYVQEVQTGPLCATYDIVRKQGDGALAPMLQHSKTEYCHHDEQLLAAWHSSIIQLELLRPEGSSPLQLLYGLCQLAKKIKSSSTGTDGPCTACEFVRCIDLDLDRRVKAILSARTGPTLQDLEHDSEKLDWRQTRSPAPCAQDNMFAKYSYQILWLFGHVIGCRFLEGPQDWADEDSFEWCMGEALKEAAAANDVKA